MSKLIVIMTHNVTPEQVSDAKEKLNIEGIVELPAELKSILSQVPSDLDDDGVAKHIAPLVQWIGEQIKDEKDIVLLQGEPCVVATILNGMSYTQNRVVHATTERVSVETQNPDGTVTKTNVFKHCRYRNYPIIRR